MGGDAAPGSEVVHQRNACVCEDSGGVVESGHGGVEEGIQSVLLMALFSVAVGFPESYRQETCPN